MAASVTGWTSYLWLTPWVALIGIGLWAIGDAWQEQRREGRGGT
jgi:hypothetical protein